MHNNKNLSLFIKISNQFLLFLPILFWIFIIYGFDDPDIAGITIISAVLHECGHILFIIFCGKGKYRLRGDLSGFRIKKRTQTSYTWDALLFASGPATNFAASFFGALLLGLFSSSSAELWIIINLTTAFSNLIPIHGYDGYGIISCLIKSSGYENILSAVLDALSLMLTAALALISLYIVARLGDSYWPAGLFIILLIKEVKRSLTLFFGDLGRYKEKIRE